MSKTQNSTKGSQGYRYSQDGAPDICIMVRKIPGSPCFMVEEIYESTDAPSGWFSASSCYIDDAKDMAEAANMMCNLVLGRRRLDAISG